MPHPVRVGYLQLLLSQCGQTHTLFLLLFYFWFLVRVLFLWNHHFDFPTLRTKPRRGHWCFFFPPFPPAPALAFLFIASIRGLIHHSYGSSVFIEIMLELTLSRFRRSRKKAHKLRISYFAFRVVGAVTSTRFAAKVSPFYGTPSKAPPSETKAILTFRGRR